MEIEEDYKSLYSLEGSEFWNSFINLARYEDFTFQLIVDCFLDPDWEEEHYIEDYVVMNQRTFDISITERLHSNHTLKSFFGKGWITLDFEEMKELLEPLYKTFNLGVLSDIYCQDMYNLQIKTIRRVPIVLFREGTYVGHIYRIASNSISCGSFIGIRESIYNMLSKVYKRNPVRAIAYYLLTAGYNYIIQYVPTATYLELNSPIGPMRKIAERFGFEDGEHFELNQPLKIHGYDSPIKVI